MKNLIIDKAAIRGNLEAVKKKAGGVEIYADLSGDAYGLGLLETAKLLRDDGIRNFAVSDPKDAALLRKNGFVEQRIMMLRSTADSVELSELIDLNVICTVGSYDSAVALNGLAEERRTVVEVQIKVDTGLGRYGFMPNETDKITAIYKYMQSLAVVGIFTSFSCSWKSKKITTSQLDSFREVISNLTSMGYEVGVTHAVDSSALFRYDFDKMDAVRVGTAFSGRVPGKPIRGLQKVGYITVGVEELCWFPKGHRIGSRIVLKKPAKLAVVSVGYYHGFGVYSQEQNSSIFDFLRNKKRTIYVRLNGHRAPVVGDVGMMYTIIDATDINCTVGDPVIMDVDPVNVKGVPRLYK